MRGSIALLLLMSVVLVACTKRCPDSAKGALQSGTKVPVGAIELRIGEGVDPGAALAERLDPCDLKTSEALALELGATLPAASFRVHVTQEGKVVVAPWWSFTTIESDVNSEFLIEVADCRDFPALPWEERIVKFLEARICLDPQGGQLPSVLLTAENPKGNKDLLSSVWERLCESATVYGVKGVPRAGGPVPG